MGDVNELQKKGTKTMANTLPTTMEYFDNLLGEQLTEGGGGSSDFSTATVTLTNGSGTTIPVIYIENVIEENALGEESPAGVINAVYNIGSTASIRVPLYKGGALWQIGDELLDYEISVSGSATKVSSAIYHITGDCTITIS